MTLEPKQFHSERPCKNCKRLFREHQAVDCDYIADAMLHRIRIRPEDFLPVYNGERTYILFEIKDSDMGLGDRVELKTWDEKTLRTIEGGFRAQIVDMLAGPETPIKDGWVLITLGPLPQEPWQRKSFDPEKKKA